MWARGRFEISWSDLAFGARQCLRPADRIEQQRRVEELWSAEGDALACYCVRSGFDLLLRNLQLPPGSEVLFSALNINGMVKVVSRLGLVPVPVDVDLEHLAPRPEALERAITPQSRVLVVAHLFGARVDLAPILEIARRHDLIVVEDCAQAFEGLGYTGHPEVDASFFSFGPLKTATALGGALARVADRELLARMRADQAGYPVQTVGAYVSRLARFAVLKSITYRWTSSLVFQAARLGKGDLDRQLEGAARRVTQQGGKKSTTKDPVKRKAEKSAEKLHFQPSAPMLTVLERRLRDAPERAIAARTGAGRQLLAQVGELAVCPGTANERKSFWLFPIMAKEPKRLMASLRAEGFDAAPLASLRTVPVPEGRDDLEPHTAKEFVSQGVILPCYTAMGAAELTRQGQALGRALGGLPPAPGPLQRFRRYRRKRVKKFGKWLIREVLADFQARQSTVGDPPIFDTKLFPAIQQLEAHWEVIRQEIDRATERWDELPGLADLSPDQDRIATDQRWKSYVIRGFGFRAGQNCRACPETARLVEGVPGLESAWFTMLAPGYHVKAHRGITKGIVTSLLGVRIPKDRENCRIRIGDEILSYTEGKAIVFDDTVSHEIWNNTDEPRIVLLVDFRRPMRWPGRLLNAAFLAAFKQTAYVKEARKRFAEWEQGFYEAGAQGR